MGILPQGPFSAGYITAAHAAGAKVGGIAAIVICSLTAGAELAIQWTFTPVHIWEDDGDFVVTTSLFVAASLIVAGAIAGSISGALTAMTNSLPAAVVKSIALFTASYFVAAMSCFLVAAAAHNAIGIVGTVIHLIVLGTFTGTVTRVFARARQSGGAWQVGLHEAFLLMAIIATLFTWNAHHLQDVRRDAEFHAVGADIQWNPFDEPLAYWEFGYVWQIRFDNGTLNDAELADLALMLSHYRELALDLGENPISDAGAKALASLDNLAYVDVHGTTITQSGIVELQRALPNVEVKW